LWSRRAWAYKFNVVEAWAWPKIEERTLISICAQEKHDKTYIENAFKDYITTRLGSLLADIIVSSNINILNLAPKRAQISDLLIKEYNELLEVYGLEIPPKMFMVTDIKMQPSAELC